MHGVLTNHRQRPDLTDMEHLGSEAERSGTHPERLNHPSPGLAMTYEVIGGSGLRWPRFRPSLWPRFERRRQRTPHAK
jgi:hypothetical protein